MERPRRKREQVQSEPKNGHLLDTFPVGDAFLEHYREHAAADPEAARTMREAVYTFLDHELRNTQLYRSEKFGVEFPFTVIRVGDLAKDLLSRHGHPPVAKLDQSEDLGPTRKLEFIMSSFRSRIGGNQFGYAELVLHRVMQSLPAAIENIVAGREPSHLDVYTLGAPSNEMGLASPSFVDALEKDAFATMGELYAEAVAAELGNIPRGEQAAVSVTLSGVSMGASMAAEAGAKLLEKETVVQGRIDDSEAPHLRVIMHVPVALNDSPLASVQIPLGFAAEAAHKFVADPAARRIFFGSRAFNDAMYRVLPDGIGPRLGDEQGELKDAALGAIRKAVTRGGTSLPKGVRVDIVRGVYDPLMFSRDNLRASKEQRTQHPNTLGSTIVPSDDSNARTFGIHMTHRLPFYRDNEMRRWDKVAKTLKEISTVPKQ